MRKNGPACRRPGSRGRCRARASSAFPSGLSCPAEIRRRCAKVYRRRHSMNAAAPVYPRDLRGHGADPPHARWPGGARIAVQFVLNYEEGGENNVLHGDAASETFLSELVTAQAYENRHMTMESMYEYGSRVGVWRILREFDARKLPLTVFGVAMALERYPELVAEFMRRDHEIACHGLRWIHYQNMPEATERRHLDIATRRPQGPERRRLAARLVHRPRQPEHAPPRRRARRLRVRQRLLRRRPAVLDRGRQGRRHRRAPHLVVPYSLDTNDMRFVQAQGFNTGEHFFSYLRDAFDALYAEGDPAGLDRPKMMSIGMHCRAARQARPDRRAAPLPRPRAGARAGLDRAAHRHRPPLARRAPACRAGRQAMARELREPASSAALPKERP